MTNEDLEKLMNEAEEGNVESIKQLIDYYHSIGDEDSANIYEDQLEDLNSEVKQTVQETPDAKEVDEPIEENDTSLESLDISTLLQKAEEGNPNACILLADKHIKNNDTEKLEYYEKAISLMESNTSASTALIQTIEKTVDIYKKHLNDEFYRNKYFQSLTKLVELQPTKTALQQLGFCYRNAIGVEKDSSKADELIQKSLEIGGFMDHIKLCCVHQLINPQKSLEQKKYLVEAKQYIDDPEYDECLVTLKESLIDNDEPEVIKDEFLSYLKSNKNNYLLHFNGFIGDDLDKICHLWNEEFNGDSYNTESWTLYKFVKIIKNNYPELYLEIIETWKETNDVHSQYLLIITKILDDNHDEAINDLETLQSNPDFNGLDKATLAEVMFIKSILLTSNTADTNILLNTLKTSVDIDSQGGAIKNYVYPFHTSNLAENLYQQLCEKEEKEAAELEKKKIQEEQAKKEAELKEKKEKTNKKIAKVLKIAIPVLIVLTIIGVLVNMYNNRTVTIDPFDYIEYQIEGINDCGELVVNFNDGDISEKTSGRCKNVEELLVLTYDKSEDLKNGDKVDIEVALNDSFSDKNIELSETSKTISVDGLEKGTKVNPFDDLEVSFIGESGVARISITNNSNDDFLKTVEFSASKSASLSLGDKVTITASATKENITKYKKYLSVSENEYIVSGIDGVITDVGGLTSEQQNTLIEKGKELLPEEMDLIDRWGRKESYKLEDFFGVSTIGWIYWDSYETPSYVSTYYAVPRDDEWSDPLTLMVYKITITGHLYGEDKMTATKYVALELNGLNLNDGMVVWSSSGFDRNKTSTTLEDLVWQYTQDGYDLTEYTHS